MSSSEAPTCSKFVKSESVNKKIIEYYFKYASDRDIKKYMRLRKTEEKSKSYPFPTKSSAEGRTGSEDSLESDDLILVIHRCDQVSPSNEPDKENSSREANKASSEPRTPRKDTESASTVPDSVTKNDKKLEWDAMADVGYMKANSTGNLSSLERSVLKELFKPPSVSDISDQRADETQQTPSYPLSTDSRREKWRQTLECLAKKYSSRSVSVHTNEFKELPQSTPKVIPNSDKSSQTTFVKPQTQSRRKINHSCQTSFDMTETKVSQEIQVNLPSWADSFGTQSSFEYLPAEAGKKRASSTKKVLSERNPNSQSSSNSESTKESSGKTDSIPEYLPAEAGNRQASSSSKKILTERNPNSQSSSESTKESSGKTDSIPEYLPAEAGKRQASSSSKKILTERNPNSQSSSESTKESSGKTDSIPEYLPAEAGKRQASSSSKKILTERNPNSQSSSESTKESSGKTDSIPEYLPAEAGKRQASSSSKNILTERNRSSQSSSNSEASKESTRTTDSIPEYLRLQVGKRQASSSSKKLNSEKHANSKSSSNSESTKESSGKNDPSHRATTDSLKKRPATEVELGIKLLCSLIDAKNLTRTQKKQLGKQIFEKITKQRPDEGSRSGDGSAMSSSILSSVVSTKSPIESTPQSKDQSEYTQIDNSNASQSLIESLPQIKDQQEQTPVQNARRNTALIQGMIEEQNQTQIDNSDARRSKALIQEMIEEQTQTEELPTKDEEDAAKSPPKTSPSLEEPVTTREWLNPLTQSEKDYDKKSKSLPSPSVGAISERSRQLNWIEMEIGRLEGLKTLILHDHPSRNHSRSSSATSKSSKYPSQVIYEETAEDLLEEQTDLYNKILRKTSKNLVIYDEPTRDKKHSDKVQYKITINEEKEPSSSSVTSGKRNHRSKLETPSTSQSSTPPSESVSEFAEQLQKQFMDSYVKKKHTMSTGHYSEPRICGKPVFTRNESYTSVATSSAFCMSSDMSIPIVDSSSSSTTTHQYDNNIVASDSVGGVAIQTSYSVIKSDPIFGPRCRCMCTCGKMCKCTCKRPTVRVCGTAFHQTVQVKPKSLAYVLHFNNSPEGDEKKVTTDEEDSFSLQKRLEMKHPDFLSRANERQEILKKLLALRQERAAKIWEIADGSSNSSIARKLEDLPPLPIKQLRICSSKEMKGRSRRRYHKLPEVIAKQDREKLERKKRTMRLITNVFNKKLQRMVHQGQLTLENSRSVI